VLLSGSRSGSRGALSGKFIRAEMPSNDLARPGTEKFLFLVVVVPLLLLLLLLLVVCSLRSRPSLARVALPGLLLVVLTSFSSLSLGLVTGNTFVLLLLLERLSRCDVVVLIICVELIG